MLIGWNVVIFLSALMPLEYMRTRWMFFLLNLSCMPLCYPTGIRNCISVPKAWDKLLFLTVDVMIASLLFFFFLLCRALHLFYVNLEEIVNTNRLIWCLLSSQNERRKVDKVLWRCFWGFILGKQEQKAWREKSWKAKSLAAF